MVHLMVDADLTRRAEVLQTVKAARGSRFWALVRRLWWLWLVIACALGVVFWFLGREPAVGPQYQTAPVVRRDLQAAVTATGRLLPLDQVEVGPELSGRVSAVHADFNQQVEAGQLLCELDAEQWRAARDQAQAQLKATRADLRSREVTLEEARLSAERTEALAQRKVEAPQVLENAFAALHRAQAAVAAARAQVALAKANLAAAETSLQKTQITSPIRGVVLSRKVEVGQTVAASFNTPVLFVLARDLTQMELTIDIDEADVGQVAVGQQATFRVDAFPARVFTAELVTIHNIAKEQQNVVTYEGVLRVHNDDLALRPGMTATVDIITEQREQAVLVPNAALRFTPPDKVVRAEPRMRIGGGGRSREQEEAAALAVEDAQLAPNEARVWVLRDGQLQSQLITLGLSDGTSSEVLAGDLRAGESEVVVDVIAEQE